MLCNTMVKSNLDYAFVESYELLNVQCSFLSSGSGFFDSGSSNTIMYLLLFCLSFSSLSLSISNFSITSSIVLVSGTSMISAQILPSRSHSSYLSQQSILLSSSVNNVLQMLQMTESIQFYICIALLILFSFLSLCSLIFSTISWIVSCFCHISYSLHSCSCFLFFQNFSFQLLSLISDEYFPLCDSSVLFISFSDGN